MYAIYFLNPPSFPTQFHHDGDYCWAGKSGTVAAIQSYLPFEVNARTIKATCTRTWEAWATGDIEDFDAGDMENKQSKGRKRILSDDEIQLALRYAREGGLDVALAMVNGLREKKRLGYDDVPPEPTRLPVVWSTVQAAVKSWGAQCHRRQSRKTGSRDEFSLWAIFRYHFAMQLQEQFSEIPDETRTEGWVGLNRCQVLFVDEHHEKCKIGKGNCSKYEWICAVDKDDPHHLCSGLPRR